MRAAAQDFYSVNTGHMSVNGLSYREYFRQYESLPPEAIEHLLRMYEDDEISERCKQCESAADALHDIECAVYSAKRKLKK